MILASTNCSQAEKNRAGQGAAGQRSERTVLDPEQLRRQLWEVREQGFARSEQETREGEVCLAVPVRNRQGASFCRIEHFRTHRSTPRAKLSQAAPDLLAAANDISRGL